jgi:ABC-type transport system involved in cytochrome bd biosynthesis fused ATPase/permease subunit
LLDTTPVGRILNRFSKDFETIDSMIPNYIIEFSKAGINVISIILVVSFTIPALMIPLAVAMISFLYLGKLFMEAGIQFRRLESINRSPIFTHFTEVIFAFKYITERFCSYQAFS